MATTIQSSEVEAVKISVQDVTKTEPVGDRVYCCGLIKLGPNASVRWLALQMFTWVLLVATITFTPVMMKYSFVGTGGIMLPNKYAAPTVHASSFSVSFLVGLVLTAAIYGKTGLRDIFRIRAILLLAPVSFGYAGSEALALFAMRTADPIMYAVIHKMRLLETALMTRIFLKRKVSIIQWVICFTVTSAVLAFVLYSLADKSTKKSDVLGPILLILNITVSVACSIYADWSYKKLGYPLVIQMPTGRITAFIGSLIIGIIFISVKQWWKYGLFGGPDGGWDIRVGLLLVYLVIRDWITCFVLLYLDALWKALAGSAAVATTYIADVVIYGKVFVPTLFMLVFAIMLSVAIYALVKVMEKNVKAQEKEIQNLQKKIAALTGESPGSDATAV